MQELRGLDDLREYILKTGPSEVELKLLNVIAIMEQTIEEYAREQLGVDFYLELEKTIEDNVEAMLAVVEGRMH